jgi:uncharacterized metal-binding protein
LEKHLACKDAALIASIISRNGLSVSAVCCTTGGITQSEVNTKSSIKKVTCNPIGQATQLNNEKIDLAVAVGLCMGHDILLQKHLNAPCTTLVVKDRTSNHTPLVSIKKMI